MPQIKQPSLLGSFVMAYSVVVIGAILSILAAIRDNGGSLLGTGVAVVYAGTSMWFKARTDKSSPTIPTSLAQQISSSLSPNNNNGAAAE